jgi:hypothetical protein
MQRANESFQQHLQEAVDNLTYDIIHRRDEGYGSIILSGSLPGVIENLLTDPTKPLYNRGYYIVRMKPFNFQELDNVFTHFGIDDYLQRLTLYTVCYGYPESYKCLFQDGLLVPMESNRFLEELYEKNRNGTSQIGKLFASSLEYYTNEISENVIEILNAIEQGKTKKEQLKKMSKLENKDRVLKILSECEMIAISCGIMNRNKTKWIISDPALRFTLLWRGITSKEEFVKKCCHIQGQVFEEVIKSMIEERYFADIPVLPCFEKPNFPYIKRGEWYDFKDAEIDIICIMPTIKTTILGACRSTSKLDISNHWSHISTAYKQMDKKIRDEVFGSNALYAVYFTPVEIDETAKSELLAHSQQIAKEHGFVDTRHFVYCLKDLWHDLHVDPPKAYIVAELYPVVEKIQSVQPYVHYLTASVAILAIVATVFTCWQRK